MAEPIINWDGKSIPEGLKQVPPGAYALVPVADEGVLSGGEEEGIRHALAQLDAGKGRSLADVVSEIRSRSDQR